MILYGKQKLDSADRCTVLERCVEEICRKPENESCKFILLEIHILKIYTSTVDVPKIVLLYGGDVDHVASVYRLMNVEHDQRKFGLVIMRVCTYIFSFFHDQYSTHKKKCFFL
jgi:hypothetical protein